MSDKKKNPKMQVVAHRNHCARKLELIKTYFESNKEGPVPEDRPHFQGLVKDLKVQFDRLETKWHEDISGNVADDAVLFEELDSLVTDTAKTVEETLENARRFLRKKPLQMGVVYKS